MEVQRVIRTSAASAERPESAAPRSIFDLGWRAPEAPAEPEPDTGAMPACCATPGECALQPGWPMTCGRLAAAPDDEEGTPCL